MVSVTIKMIRWYPMVFGGGYREALCGEGWRLVCFDLGFAK
ncbi:hypothetical protein EC40967_4694 [Escherichia coli 4.0967]|uniref:Uncharacterized protein n=1 Tax=Escherichia coli 4.0967 TaxID=869687 RepID=A0AAN3V9V0_ECOLX|nr:hypothetical protein EC40967_4694 [Escherichia coli 4.0967]